MGWNRLRTSILIHLTSALNGNAQKKNRLDRLIDRPIAPGDNAGSPANETTRRACRSASSNAPIKAIGLIDPAFVALIGMRV
jgi:hypothetical protein